MQIFCLFIPMQVFWYLKASRTKLKELIKTANIIKWSPYSWWSMALRFILNIREHAVLGSYKVCVYIDFGSYYHLPLNCSELKALFISRLFYLQFFLQWDFELNFFHIVQWIYLVQLAFLVTVVLYSVALTLIKVLDA